MTLYATVCGYSIFVLASTPKDRVCQFIQRRGPVMHPYTTSSTFFGGTTLCNGVVVLRALEFARLDYVVIHGYGMKMIVDFMEPLVPMIVDIPLVSKRLDAGANNHTTWIKSPSENTGVGNLHL
uniref:Uncharacterized protein n=1 Tax=Amphimedon queenslandica TaxID=400682 RepID=A0A1X7TWI8_AMPQE